MDPLNIATEVAPTNPTSVEETLNKPVPSWYGPRMKEAQRLLDERRSARLQANSSYGISDYAADIARAPARGFEGMAHSVTNLVTKPVRWGLSKVGVNVPDWEERILGRSKTTVGGIVEGLTQFLSGAVLTGGAVGAVSKSLGAAAELTGAGAVTKTAAQVASGLTESTVSASAARGAITDFSAFGAHEERLSNLIQEFPSLSNPVTQYLQASDDDNEAEGRLKNAVEGLLVGATAEVVLKTVKALGKGYRKIFKGGSGSEANAILNEELSSSDFQNKVKQAIEEQQSNIQVEKPTVSETEFKTATEGDKSVTSSLEPDAAQPFSVNDVKAVQQAKDDLKNTAKQDNKLASEFIEAFDKKGELPTSINFSTFGDKPEDFKSILEAAGRTIEKRFKTRSYDALKTEGRAMAADIVERMSDTPEEVQSILRGLATAGEDQVKAVIAAGDIMNSATFGLQNHIDTWLNPGPLKNFPVWNRNQIDGVIGRYLRTMGEAKKIKSYSGMALQANKAQKQRFFTMSEQRAMQSERDALQKRTIERLKQEGKWTEGASTKQMLDADELYNQQLAALDEAARKAKDTIENELRAKTDAEFEASLTSKTSALLKLSDDDLRVLLSDIQAVADPNDAAKLINTALTEVPANMWKHYYGAFKKYWRSSLLYQVPTQLTNVVGGGLKQAMVIAQRGLGGDLKGAMRMARGATYSMLEASKLAWQAFKHGPILESTSFMDKPHAFGIKRSSFAEGAFGDASYYASKAMNVPFQALAATDEFVKQTGVRSYLYADFMVKGEAAGLKGFELNQWVGQQMSVAIDARGRMWSFENTMKAGFEEATIRGITDRSQRYKFAVRYAEEMATRDMTVETVDAIERAKKYGQEITFQTPLDPSGLQSRIGKLIESIPVLDLVVPFYKTPINIFKDAFKNTPLLGQVYDVMLGELTHANPERRAMARGRMAQSTLMMPTVVALASNGTITGHGPSNPREREILMRTGWQPYSFKIGDTWHSYLRFDPLSTPIGLIADITEHWNNGHESSDLHRATASLIMAFAWNIGSKSYLKGMSQFVELLSAPNEGRFNAFTKNLATPLIPGIFKSIKTVVEQNQNDPMKDVRTIVDAWIDRIPYGEQVFGHIIDRRFNALGDPVQPRTGGWLEKTTTIIARSKHANDSIMDELSSIGATVGKPGYYLGGAGGVDLRRIRIGDQSAYGRYQELVGTVRISGRTLRQELATLLRSSEYRKLSAEKTETGNSTIMAPREQKIRSVISKYRDAARQQLQRELPQETRQNLSSLKQLKTDLKKGKTNTNEVRKFISKMQ